VAFYDEKATVPRRAVLKRFMQMRRLCGAAHEADACIACFSAAFARNESKYIALQQSIKLRETPRSISKGIRHDLPSICSCPARNRTSRRGLLFQLFDAMMVSCRRQIESKIAR
jgi:hypothetical protein